MIRNAEQKVVIGAIDGGAQVTLDTIAAWGLGNGVTITWHEVDDLSDPPQQWSSEMP